MKRLIGVLGILALLAADDPKDMAKQDLAALQGEWTMVSGVANGMPMPPEMAKTMKRVCKDDLTTVTMNGQMYFQAKVTLDPAQNPKLLTYEMLEGPTKGKTQLGIYEITGDTVRFCMAAPDAERPKEFKSEPGSKCTLSVWKHAEK